MTNHDYLNLLRLVAPEAIVVLTALGVLFIDLGGLRGLVHVRAILGNVGVNVLPDQVTVSKAHEAFREDGALVNEKQAAKVKNLGAVLTRHLAKLLA